MQTSTPRSPRYRRRSCVWLALRSTQVEREALGRLQGLGAEGPAVERLSICSEWRHRRAEPFRSPSPSSPVLLVCLCSFFFQWLTWGSSGVRRVASRLVPSPPFSVLLPVRGSRDWRTVLFLHPQQEEIWKHNGRASFMWKYFIRLAVKGQLLAHQEVSQPANANEGTEFHTTHGSDSHRRATSFQSDGSDGWLDP